MGQLKRNITVQIARNYFFLSLQTGIEYCTVIFISVFTVKGE